LSRYSISVEAKAFPYSGGSGTADDPYQIATADDLLELRASPDHYDAHFILTADIDLAPCTFTTAVTAYDTDNLTGGFQGDAFTGVFDGNGHIINNLTINTSGAGNDYLGLFGHVDGGEIKNLRLSNVSIISGDDSIYVGGLAGFNQNGNINNCYSTGTVTAGDNTNYLGGFGGK
jgi:hypothetical protein